MTVVGDEWEVTPQLDSAGQLASALVGAADCFGGLLINGEHGCITAVGWPQANGPARPTLAWQMALTRLGADREPWQWPISPRSRRCWRQNNPLPCSQSA